MPCATFLFSKTGSPLSSQDPFSHENFLHAGGGPAFLRVWPWSRGGRTEEEITHSFGCPLQLLLARPLPHFPERPHPSPATHRKVRLQSLSTLFQKGNTNLQLQSQQEGTFSLLNPAPNMENSLSPGISHQSPQSYRKKCCFLSLESLT